MRAGLLRHKTVITKPTGNSALDDLGFAASTSSEHATVWASIEPLRGREFVEARQLHATVSHKIRFRAADAIIDDVRPSTAMWLTYNSRKFEFLEVRMIDEREVMFECLAGERQSSSTAGVSA